MSKAKEIAKFLSGVETFHAVAHTYLWSTGTTLNVLGVTATPDISLISAGVSGVLALALAIYAWK